ncbi:MAG: methyl-accepting chemotaxis protein [Leptolyngbyaceae cyanobacterium bins.59]|nr:methyl-accepting chemotaxis protein [Leptolyngbyaceae cyanobacterium bins.59]
MFDLKLKGRMLLGYTVPVVIYLGLAGLVYSTATQVSTTFQEVKRVQSVLDGVNTIDADAQIMVRSVRGYMVLENSAFLEDYQKALDNTKEVAKTVEKLIVDPEQKKKLGQLIELIDSYDQGVGDSLGASEIVQVYREGQKNKAIKLLRESNLTQFVDKFDLVAGEMMDTERKLLEKKTGQAESAMSLLVTALILGSLVMLAGAVLIALLISSGISRMIKQAVNDISTSSTEIAVTVEEHERTATQQAAAVSQTTTTMDELGASSRQSAEQAEAAATGAKQVLALMDSGNQMSGSSLREKVGQIAEQILRLSEQTSQIGTISTLVSDLANQTNMLALNAAVEAVRAGEHGKGFGVVAAEIRKLADQSKKSAERINTLVMDIQNATNSTVMVTDEGTKTVENIVTAVNNIALNSQQISLTAKQQAIAIQQVVDAMNAINQGASQTAAGISQTKVGTQKLNEAAQNLKSVV